MKKITLAIVAFAALGMASLASTPASAKGFHGGFKGGGFHGKHFGHRHGYWGHRRHFGWGYGVYGIPVAAYAAECFYVRRYGGLIKVCE